MIVQELIAELSDLPPDLQVHLADESGDYRVPVARAEVKGTINDAGGDGPVAACIVGESA